MGAASLENRERSPQRQHGLGHRLPDNRKRAGKTRPAGPHQRGDRLRAQDHIDRPEFGQPVFAANMMLVPTHNHGQWAYKA
jgi:hypothetical protein